MEFSRFELLVGLEIKKIRDLKVLVVGVGGVGGYAVEALARSGVNNISLVDYDKVDITNINRQIIALHSTLNELKVEVLKRRIQDINPECLVTTYPIFYGSETKEAIDLSCYDYILDCCDSIKTKEFLIREAVSKKIKIISSMGAGFKFDPSKIKITKLKNTSYDKLAKKLRYLLKDNKKCLEVPVVFSEEVGLKKEGNLIGSNSFIPSIFGLYMASFVINDIRRRK